MDKVLVLLTGQWSVAMVALLTVLLCCTIVSITYWSVAMVATYIGCVVVLCCNVLCFVLFCCVGQYILVSGNCCHIGEQLQWFYFIKPSLSHPVHR